MIERHPKPSSRAGGVTPPMMRIGQGCNVSLKPFFVLNPYAPMERQEELVVILSDNFLHYFDIFCLLRDIPEITKSLQIVSNYNY